ncbi:hypothetical protein Q1695_001137 [Nippostrongylus brasiliensis]|nr:hypothetical protein Q1695_001137 [Nippostrongylus brasiliensis]
MRRDFLASGVGEDDERNHVGLKPSNNRRIPITVGCIDELLRLPISDYKVLMYLQQREDEEVEIDRRRVNVEKIR